MDDAQLERLHSAVERKKQRSKADSERVPRRGTDGASALSDEQPSLTEQGRPQETRDPRAKNEGHRKKTADKWNQ
jgi:hypothetical protein